MPNVQKSSLAEKLKTLGVKVGTAGIEPGEKKPAGVPIQQVVEGSFQPTKRGEVFIAGHGFPLEYCHGDAPIAPLPAMEAVADWARDSHLLSVPAQDMVYLDTETSGLAGGTGTYAFLVGVGRFSESGFQLSQFFMRDPAEEAAMLEALAEYLAGGQVLVTFNGKAFDAPLLGTRYSLHNIPNPLAEYSHLDLLPLARRLWRDRLPSRALKYIEENVLMAPRTVEEVPGYEIPYLYFDYLRSADATPLKGVFYHNAMDVVAMSALLVHAATMMAEPMSERIEHGLDRIALAKLFEDLGRWELAARLYERGLEQSLPEADFATAVKRLSILQRRRGDLTSAVALWEKAAQDGHIYAMLELAKYHEHARRDPTAALAWTARAVERVRTLDIPRYEFNHWMEELEHRQERLKGKMK